MGWGQQPGDRLSLLGGALAWIGVWGTWIPHPTAALTYNAVDLTVWVGFLWDVRFGSLGGKPDILRAGLAAAAVTLALCAGVLKRPGARWVLRLAALVIGLILLPPYPQVLDLWRSEEYGIRFLIAAGSLVGVLLSGLVDFAPAQMRRASILATSGLAIWQTLRAYLVFRPPFEAHYNHAIPLGWGMLLFVGGLALAGGGALYGALTTSVRRCNRQRPRPS